MERRALAPLHPGYNAARGGERISRTGAAVSTLTEPGKSVYSVK
jgi:hypothetical protein